MSNLFPTHSPNGCPPERIEPTATRADRVVEGSLPSGGILCTKLLRVGEIALAALREIFDESAYTRFLSRHQLPNSRESYAAFCREHGQMHAQRPRCC